MADPSVSSEVRRLPLFTYLSSEQLEAVAGAFQQRRYRPGDRLYRQGEDSQAMYLFVSGGGRILHTGPDGAERVQGEAGPGAFVGEETLFARGRRDSSVAITQESTVLVLTKASFDAVLQARSDIRPLLNMPKELMGRLQAQKERGVRSDEATLLITRRHPWAFAGRALRGAILFAVLIGLALASTQLPREFAQVLPLLLCGAAVLLPVLLGVYYVLEWRNDFFVITNQRVIHEERFLLTGEERREQALLSSIQNVNVSRGGAIAEVIGFGDVVISTAGNQQPLVLSTIPDPMRIQQAIFQQIQRRKDQDAADSQDAIRAQIDAVLTGASGSESATSGSVPFASQGSPGLLTRLIWAVFPPGRLVEGDRITYHKHWIMLLGGLAKPTLFIVLLAVLVAVRLSSLFAPLNDVPDVVFWGGALILLALGGFWWYWQYADWRDDIYILDNQSITDIKRRPLWLRETRIQAGLQQIQNVTSEIPSFWAQLFNYGSVIIQTAAEHGTMAFRGVHNPTGVAEEVLQRVQRRAETEANAGQDEQRRLVAQYLSEYHKATQDNSSPSQPAAPPARTGYSPPPASQTQPLRPIWRGTTGKIPPPGPSGKPSDRTMPGEIPEMPPDRDQTQPRKPGSDTQRIEPPKTGE